MFKILNSCIRGNKNIINDKNWIEITSNPVFKKQFRYLMVLFFDDFFGCGS